MAAANPAVPGKKPGLLINRNFALLWTGQSISLIGDWMFDTTLLAIRPPQFVRRADDSEPGRNFLREFRDGLRFYFSNRVLTTILISLLVFGAVTLVLSRMTSFWAGSLLFFLFGIPQGTGNVVVMPLLLHVTPSLVGYMPC
jgi:hypothetical protein